MYNAEIKTKFVRDYTQNLSVADFCESLFKAVGSFEDEYQNTLYYLSCLMLFYHQPSLREKFKRFLEMLN